MGFIRTLYNQMCVCVGVVLSFTNSFVCVCILGSFVVLNLLVVLSPFFLCACVCVCFQFFSFIWEHVWHKV